MADSETIKSNVLKLQTAKASSQDIEQYVKLATSEPDFKTLTPNTIRQEQGDIPTKDSFLAMLPTKEQLPEFIGSMAGGPFKKTLPGMAMSAGGAAIGDAVRQAIFKDRPLSGKERLLSMAKAAGRGAFGDIVGRGIGAGFSAFHGSVTPEIQAGMQAAERAGVNPPLSATTESPVVQSLERYAELGPFGGGITRAKQESVKQLGEFAESISDGISPESPPEIVGEIAKDKVKNFESVFKKAKDALYEPINTVLKDKPVEPTNTIAAIKEVLSRQEGGKEGRGLLMDWLERLQPKGQVQATVEKEFIDPLTNQAIKYKVPATQKILNKFGTSEIDAPLNENILPRFNVLKAIRTEIGSRGNFNDPGVTGMKAQLEGLYAAASKDMENEASKYGMKDALDAVNSQYATGIKKLQNSLVKAINVRAEKSPESLHKLLIRNNAPTLIKTGKEILGEDGFNQVKKQWFDDLVNRSKSIIEGEEVVSPSKLANNLRKVGSSLSEITDGNPELAEKLADLSDVSKLLTRGQAVTRGSQTAYLRDALVGIRSILAAPLVQTETGRAFLTTGFPKIGKFAERMTQTGTQLGLQKVSE